MVEFVVPEELCRCNYVRCKDVADALEILVGDIDETYARVGTFMIGTLKVGDHLDTVIRTGDLIVGIHLSQPLPYDLTVTISVPRNHEMVEQYGEDVCADKGVYTIEAGSTLCDCMYAFRDANRMAYTTVECYPPLPDTVTAMTEQTFLHSRGVVSHV
jgi:hypothetical protein